MEKRQKEILDILKFIVLRRRKRMKNLTTTEDYFRIFAAVL